MKDKITKPNRKAAAGTLAESAGRRAHYLTSPHGTAAVTLQSALKAAIHERPELLPDILTVVDLRGKNSKKVNHGDLTAVEATLESQGTVLNYLFNQMAQMAFSYKLDSETFERTFRLGLRAQAQSARTLEILANIKQGPRVVFAQQLNAAHQQIVNNVTSPADANEPQIVRSAQNQKSPPTSKILKNTPTLQTHAPLDPRSPRETESTYPQLAAVDKVQRSQHSRRKAGQQP